MASLRSVWRAALPAVRRAACSGGIHHHAGVTWRASLPALQCVGSPPARSMFIQTEKTPNPSSMKFLPGQVVLPEEQGQGMFFQKGDRDYQRSPLAVRLFQIEEVTGVFFGRDFITISLSPGEDWQFMRPMVFSILMDFFAEEIDVVSSEPVVTDTTILEDDDEVVAMIKELLETRVRPAVQEDGGDILYVGFDESTGIVKVQLAGSCQGCPSSSVTLKNGVENMLMHYIPEVKGVEELDEDLAQSEREQREFEESLKRGQ